MRWKIIRRPLMHAKYFMLHKVFFVQKLSNKQSAKVICRLDKLRMAHTARVMKHLSAAHAFDYIVLRINPGLTTCKDLAMMVYNCLDNN